MDKSKANLRLFGRSLEDYFRSLDSIHGAEGNGDEGADESQESESEKKGGEESTTTTPPEEKTYTKAEYDAIVKESKNYRKRAQDAESKLSDADKAKMGELERAQTEAKEQKERADELEAQLSRFRIEGFITKEATAQNFADPSDAVAFLDMTSLKLNDDGEPDTNSLKAAVKKIAAEKPHLIKGAGGAGSGDGGARGGHGTDKTADYDKEYQGRNMVPIG